MAKHSNISGVGRDHPASKSVPGGSSVRSPFGRDTDYIGTFPTGGKVPTGPKGRDHPAAKGPEVPPMSDPFGRSKK